jgi:hypothetical protein
MQQDDGMDAIKKSQTGSDKVDINIKIAFNALQNIKRR